MALEMTVKQGDNGWILNFVGRSGQEKVVVCTEWNNVFTELDDYFGWYDLAGKQTKISQNNRQISHPNTGAWNISKK